MNKLESECNVIISDTEKKSSPSACRGIYGLQNKLSPDKWYVGQSLDILSRWDIAYKRMYCKKQPKIYNALKKYGYENFEKVVLEECDESVLTEREDFWMKYYNSIENGYNIREASSKGSVAEETKQKISKSMKGRKYPERASIPRSGHKRKSPTLETRQKISLSLIKRFS